MFQPEKVLPGDSLVLGVAFSFFSSPRHRVSAVYFFRFPPPYPGFAPRCGGPAPPWSWFPPGHQEGTQRTRNPEAPKKPRGENRQRRNVGPLLVFFFSAYSALSASSAVDLLFFPLSGEWLAGEAETDRGEGRKIRRRPGSLPGREEPTRILKPLFFFSALSASPRFFSSWFSSGPASQATSPSLAGSSGPCPGSSRAPRRALNPHGTRKPLSWEAPPVRTRSAPSRPCGPSRRRIFHAAGRGCR